MDYNNSIKNIPMPDRIKRLPISPKGFPVPWFVAFIDGVPDFRIIDAGKIEEAVNRKKCWTCGDPLGAYMAMILGPMCAINRTISEPPSHRECAVYSACACPFLSNPKMRRNCANLPAETHDAAGNGIKRNPGAVAVWITKGYRPFRAPGGVLFTFDDPTEVLWFAEGRAATREEVEASIYSGLPLLEADAAAEGPLDLSEKLFKRLKYLVVFGTSDGSLTPKRGENMYAGDIWEGASRQYEKLEARGFVERRSPHNPAHKDRAVITQAGIDFLASRDTSK